MRSAHPCLRRLCKSRPRDGGLAARYQYSNTSSRSAPPYMQMLLVLQTPGEPEDLLSRPSRKPHLPTGLRIDNLVDSAGQAPWLCTSCRPASCCIAGLLTVAGRCRANLAANAILHIFKSPHPALAMRVTAWSSCARERQRSSCDNVTPCIDIRSPASTMSHVT